MKHTLATDQLGALLTVSHGAGHKLAAHGRVQNLHPEGVLATRPSD